jgi:beta-glucanase (GH16 family)
MDGLWADRYGRPMGLVWADECTGTAGAPPDPGLWGWHPTDAWQHADELQTYTDDPVNAHYDGRGDLVITAIRQGGDRYTSARLNARRSVRPGVFRYGYFEARLHVPVGGGVLPAWWLLGPDDVYGWPQCGEIDVMEAPASPQTKGQVHQGSHSPPADDGDAVGVGVAPSTGDWGGSFHVYGMHWTPGRLEFFIDSVSTGRVTRGDVESRGGRWVFDDHGQSPMLTLAVGGWAGRPDEGWTRQSMIVDWVRIHDCLPAGTLAALDTPDRQP